MPAGRQDAPVTKPRRGRPRSGSAAVRDQLNNESLAVPGRPASCQKPGPGAFALASGMGQPVSAIG
jgi:hypothetical protein